jgi:hypothetical protein
MAHSRGSGVARHYPIIAGLIAGLGLVTNSGVRDKPRRITGAGLVINRAAEESTAPINSADRTTDMSTTATM